MDSSDFREVLSGAVLVVDDEELMREVISMTVEDNGGRVYAAANGRDALRLVEEHQEIDLIFMDFSMPGMNGYETYLAMKEKKDALDVVFFSGLAVTPEVGELADKKEVEFVAKPFKAVELLQAAKRLRQSRKVKSA